MVRLNRFRFFFRKSKQTAIVLFSLAATVATCGIWWLAAVPTAHAANLLRLDQSIEAMGSTYSIAVYGEDRKVLESAVDQAFDEVQRLDNLLSNYKPDSDWSEVNRFAAERPVSVPQDLFDLLAACVDYSRKSEGAFDITVGPLMRVWGFYKGTGHLPARDEIAEARLKTGWENLELRPENRTVRFRVKGLEMDPGGIGKGYAVDRMAAILRRNGVKIALVSASGSSIYAMGAPPDQEAWHIQIKDPRSLAKTIQDVALKNESLSTSGSYEKFFKAGGRVYSHIMDPRTGYPAEGMLAVSVITPRTIDSEAWTKPLFVNGRDWANQHRAALPAGLRAYFCEDKTNQPCVWLQ